MSSCSASVILFKKKKKKSVSRIFAQVKIETRRLRLVKDCVISRHNHPAWGDCLRAFGIKLVAIGFL